jgi:hypothetical protein
MVAPDRDIPPPPPSNQNISSPPIPRVPSGVPPPGLQPMPRVPDSDPWTDRLPSRHFCETGELEPGERYHPFIHNLGTTPQERCDYIYYEYANSNANASGGKRRTRRTRRIRKNKKSRKNRRKSRRHRR